MSELIGRLESWLREHRPEYFAQLAPGATDEQIRSFEKLVGAELPAEFLDLYRWRNGQPLTCYQRLHDNLSFSSLEAVGESWETLTELLDAGEFEGELWWQRGWIPFLENGGGDHLCLDLQGSFTGRRGQVLEFWHDDPERVVLFPDFSSYLETLVRSLEETEWEDGEEFWESDPAVAARVSPGYPKRFKAGP